MLFGLSARGAVRPGFTWNSVAATRDLIIGVLVACAVAFLAIGTEWFETLNARIRENTGVNVTSVVWLVTILWLLASTFMLRRYEETNEALYHAWKAREASEEIFRNIVLLCSEGIMVIGRDDTVLFWNPAAQLILGHEFDRDRFKLPFSGPGSTEMKVKRTGRRECFAELSATGTRWEGRPARLVVCRDVTERRRAEEELRASQEEFVQTQKMEAVGSLAGGVAHDFNNLLSVIHGYGQILDQSLKKDDSRGEAIQEILKASRQAAEMTRQLLAFGRREPTQPKVLDLNGMIRSLHPLFGKLLGNEINIVPDLDDALQTIKVDQDQLEEILVSLSQNARDAMPKGGELKLKTLNDGDEAVLRVGDTGRGIDNDVLPRIFEPFFSTKEKKGAGMGLATVYGLVKQNGGTISVRSGLGEGTTFEIRFPSFIDVPEATGRQTILVADDEEPIRTLLSKVLGSAGFEVLVAKDGPEACQIAREHAGTIDLLLTDVLMPGMTGVELARTLQEARSDLKIMFMTGKTEGALLPGESIAKPFQRPDLIRMINRITAV